MSEVDYFPCRSSEASRYLIESASLIDMLRQLPAGSKVTVNAVGNLAVLNKDNEQIGYIEIRNNGEFIDYSDSESQD